MDSTQHTDFHVFHSTSACNKWKSDRGKRHTLTFYAFKPQLLLSVELMILHLLPFFLCHDHEEKNEALWATRAHRQDLHLWLPAVKWQEATASKSCWSRCRLTGLQYSTGARCRKWAHYLHFHAHNLPSHQYTNLLPTTCAGLTGCPPPSTTSTTLLLLLHTNSFTAVPLHQTAHWAHFVVLHSTASTTSMKIWFGLL